MRRSEASKGEHPPVARELFSFSPVWLIMLAVIFAAGLAVRLYDLADPPLDFHPTRQLHSALIARGMYYQTTPNVSAEQRALAVEQWRTEGIIEPQVFEQIVAWTYALAGEADLQIPRLYAIGLWMAAAGFLTALAIRLIGRSGALAAALIFLMLPYAVVASRAFQPEPLMIALIAAALLSAVRWEHRMLWGRAILTGLLAGLAIFIKSTAVFFLGPALFVIALAGGGPRSLQVWVMALLAVLPYAVYHFYGVYITGTLVEQFSLRFFPEMWLDPAFYLRWLSNLERMAPFGLVLAALAGVLLVLRPYRRWLLFSLWLGYFLYGMTLPHHISTHDYYHLPLMIPIALGVGALAQAAFGLMRGSRGWAVVWASLLLIAAAGVYGYQARNQLKRFDAAAQARTWSAIGAELGRGAGVVALADDYGSGLKYYGWINPRNWLTAEEITWRESIGQSFDFEAEFRALAGDADYFVIIPPAELDRQPELKEALDGSYTIHRQTPEYVIYDLLKPGQ